MSAPARIDIFSDTVCPWCYLGKRRFEAALEARPQYEPRVIWRPFELNPDLPPEGVDRARHLAARGDLKRNADTESALVALGETVGIAFRFDLIERIPNTRRSHLLIAHAARRGAQPEVVDRLTRAYFEEGRDIGDLDERECRSALVLRAGQDGVVAAARHAAALGITGVPTFIFDGQYRISGALEIEALAGVLDQVAEIAAAGEDKS